MPGESEGNLSAFKAYQTAKAPRPHYDLFYPKILEPSNWLIVFLNAGTEVVVFPLALLSVSPLNQQPFGKEPVARGILSKLVSSRLAFLARWISRRSGG